MSHADPGPLAGYNSLQDKHLVGYFNNTRMRRHLRRSGLITRDGQIVTESSFRLTMARREHQRHVRDLMAQAIVHKALDMERHRQAQIKHKLEEIAKVELVQRVRSSRGRKGDEDITPYLSPRAPSSVRPKSAKQERPRSVAGHRPATAPAKRPGTGKKKSTVYVDGDGFPVHRDQAWASDEDDPEVDSHNLRELDPYVLNSIALNLTPEQRENHSPYQVDLALPEPRPTPPRAPQPPKKSPRGPSRTVITKDGRRIRPKSNKGSLALHRKEPAFPHPTQQQTLCDVTVRYRGNTLKLQYERQDKRDEVVVQQQHCGGENLVVFHGLVEPGTDLVFTSRRHRGYPFSLTFYVNQIQVLRLSACCEYKYGPGVLLGGRKGHFKFGRVDGGSPCYRCMVEAELARRERQRYKDTQTEEPEPEPEPVPVLESQGTQSDPPPPDTRDQSEQAAEGERSKSSKKSESVRESSRPVVKSVQTGILSSKVVLSGSSKTAPVKPTAQVGSLKSATARNALGASPSAKFIGGIATTSTRRPAVKTSRRFPSLTSLPGGRGCQSATGAKTGARNAKALREASTGRDVSGNPPKKDLKNRRRPAQTHSSDDSDPEPRKGDQRDPKKVDRAKADSSAESSTAQKTVSRDTERGKDDGQGDQKPATASRTEDSDEAERGSPLYGSDTSVSEDLTSSYHYSS